MDESFVTEVPSSLKRLVRMVMRGFYTIEHVIVIDMLIRNPCMKEDDLVELLQFERKQLRSVIAQLKNDRFVKVRLRMETGPDGKATRQNYYYINYKVFVNVVKYKLDHMRRKIEMEERDLTSRASFKCETCEKTFTDLEAGQLFDMTTGEFKCSYCNSIVEEDSSALPRTDSRLLLAKFNEQIEPLYILLREVEDIRLAPEILEPEPTDVSQLKRDADIHDKNKNQNKNPMDSVAWSGSATRNRNFMLGNEQAITINLSDSNNIQDQATIERKERPVWMTESTVTNGEQAYTDSTGRSDSIDPLIKAAQSAAQPHIHSHPLQPSSTPTPAQPLANKYQPNRQVDIMEVLLAHENKESTNTDLVIPGASGQDMNISREVLTDSNAGQEDDVEEMESEEEDDDMPFVLIGSERVSLQAITDEHINRMTPSEKDAYIKLSQEMYSNMYE